MEDQLEAGVMNGKPAVFIAAIVIAVIAVLVLAMLASGTLTAAHVLMGWFGGGLILAGILGVGMILRGGDAEGRSTHLQGADLGR